MGSGLTSITAVPRANAWVVRVDDLRVPTTTMSGAPCRLDHAPAGSSGENRLNHTMSGQIRPPQSQTGGSARRRLRHLGRASV